MCVLKAPMSDLLKKKYNYINQIKTIFLPVSLGSALYAERIIYRAERETFMRAEVNPEHRLK